MDKQPMFRVCEVYNPDLGTNIYMIYDFCRKVYIDNTYMDRESAIDAMLRILSLRDKISEGETP